MATRDEYVKETKLKFGYLESKRVRSLIVGIIRVEPVLFPATPTSKEDKTFLIGFRQLNPKIANDPISELDYRLSQAKLRWMFDNVAPDSDDWLGKKVELFIVDCAVNIQFTPEGKRLDLRKAPVTTKESAPKAEVKTEENDEADPYAEPEKDAFAFDADEADFE